MTTISPLGVFINCPFDKNGYRQFFEAITFTVIRCGFDARCALDTESGNIRINNIMDLIEACPYGIHDISHTELDPKNHLPRFNMPLELGIFLGARRYGSKAQLGKQCLILDRAPFRYQKFISDISGQDVHSHSQSVPKLIGHVRDFLRTIGEHVPGGTKIFSDFKRFEEDKPQVCRNLELNWKRLAFRDLTFVIGKWTSERA